MESKIEKVCFEINFVGKVEGEGWPHFLWHVAISRTQGHKKAGFTYTTSYKTGLGLSTNGKAHTPTQEDVLECLVSEHDVGQYSFYDFCSNFEYSEDSISAFEMYRKCGHTTKAIKKLFTEAELDVIRRYAD